VRTMQLALRAPFFLPTAKAAGFQTEGSVNPASRPPVTCVLAGDFSAVYETERIVSRYRLSVAVFAVLLSLTACGPRGPLRSFDIGEELAFYSFDRPDDFEQGSYGAASLLIRDGVYRIDVREGDNELWWGQWGETYDDVVIDVDVEQLSQRNENAYGVMCRVRGHVGQPVDVSDLTATATSEAEATPAATAEAEATAEATEAAATESATPETTEQPTEEATRDTRSGTVIESGTGDGYLFLIQGSGSAAIMRARGRALTPLVDWQTSEAINVGPAKNHLRAVCVGDYLAFYVNDVLVADTTDNAYQSGQVGLAASAANRLGVRVEFDNLSVKAATAG